MTKTARIRAGAKVQLPKRGAFPEQVHVFDEDSAFAIEAALGARRPLLVRGEPGTGKSQLAFAAAVELGRPCVAHVMDARVESRDLLWSFDDVARLGTAQMLSAMRSSTEDVMDRLDERHFVRPGVLWWGFDWKSAARHGRADSESRASSCSEEGALASIEPPSKWNPNKDGVVVLIDEIDKADSDVPNGLLEVLGHGEFRPRGSTQRVRMNPEAAPLVVITTNEERALPDAFLRRCLVLTLALPSDDDELASLLCDRGRAHFPGAEKRVLEKAAALLIDDRRAVRDRGWSPPGQAEYLDLLRIVTGNGRKPSQQVELLERFARFTFQKHPHESGA
ncbi:MAG: AAA domain-containing protein [bacterium]|nr:AAA domain-containing protein [bacterium]